MYKRQAYDEDLGITIEAPHVMRSGQKLKKKELNQAMTGNNMEWNSKKATKSNGQYDLKTFEVKARPVTKLDGLRPGMSLIIKNR